jgi:hypothetical protein
VLPNSVDKMKNDGKSIISILIVTNVLAMFFYYSPISLYGYWTDAVFLLTASLTTIGVMRKHKINMISKVLKVVSMMNLIALVFTSISVFHGLLPVRIIPKGHFEDNDTYAYFLGRGNLGIIGRFYGEIQYHQQIPWLPILELRIATAYSEMDYDDIMNGT